VIGGGGAILEALFKAMARKMFNRVK
jgi:hypothetical protein